MSDIFTGEINLDGKKYQVSVIDGVRYIEGMTIEEFQETLTPEQLRKFVFVGLQALKDERRGSKKIDYQDLYNLL